MREGRSMGFQFQTDACPSCVSTPWSPRLVADEADRSNAQVKPGRDWDWAYRRGKRRKVDESTPRGYPVCKMFPASRFLVLFLVFR